MRRVKEAIVVEGRYDKNALSQVVDAVILETAGFGVFKDGEKLELLRRLAEKQGLIILTDPDGAGFVIRNFLKGAIPKEQVKHAYIPDIYGKERRKRAPGKEGKLGVEGVSPQILLEALTRAGATFLDEEGSAAPRGEWTPADLYALGLTGQPDSAQRRKQLLAKLGLPERMNTKALLVVLNALYSPEELEELL
jgi:ribonuclease M5